MSAGQVLLGGHSPGSRSTEGSVYLLGSTVIRPWLLGNVDGNNWRTNEFRRQTRQVQRTKRLGVLAGSGCDHQDVERLVIHNKEGMYLKLVYMFVECRQW
jgi:hypothetical protein